MLTKAIHAKTVFMHVRSHGGEFDSNHILHIHSLAGHRDLFEMTLKSVPGLGGVRTEGA